ncbi:MAG: hypothetical protein COS84_06140 [Armatimonadetes bacterium CG07_land_8_20_14_0_80_40_9]|nr:MAG: hypothetical protein COS84_06140 [Armatimonadetes bacterium CG07_land_8_20_14_0_80_40_9]
MLKEFIGDLHIHTCLSPCGDKDMVPTRIVKEAQNLGLNFIGISDHNSVENIFAVKKVGEKFGVKVLGGIEITSEEEVHILAFFDEDWSLVKIQEIVYENLGNEENDETLFGEQLIIDENDRIIGKNRRFLIGATELKVEEIVDVIHNLDGLAIAAHVDRESFGIIGQLGFIPKELKLDAVEVSPLFRSQPRIKYGVEVSPVSSTGQNLPIVSFSDAHRIEDIGKSFTTFFLEEVTVNEIKKALLNQDGRGVI